MISILKGEPSLFLFHAELKLLVEWMVLFLAILTHFYQLFLSFYVLFNVPMNFFEQFSTLFKTFILYSIMLLGTFLESLLQEQLAKLFFNLFGVPFNLLIE